MKYKIRNLTDADFEQWYHFISKVYRENHILTDWPFIKWFFGNAPDCRPDIYESLIAVLPNGKIVGTHCALPAQIRVLNNIYSFCWYANLVVLPKYRKKGIGKVLVNVLLDKFDVCGGIGPSPEGIRIFKQEGYKFFDDITMKRFIMIIRPEGFDLVSKIGFDREAAKKLVPPLKHIPSLPKDVVNLITFNDDVHTCLEDMEKKIKVITARSANYLNWRYFLSPRVNYECTAKIDGKKWLAYLVARHERYFPTNFYAMRIVDLAGTPEHSAPLLKALIVKAKNQGDILIEFSYTGNYYDELMENLSFTELKGSSYEWWPLVTTPIEKRENHENIFLKSRKYPNLFDNIKFSDTYFVRGDSDRDRANLLK